MCSVGRDLNGGAFLFAVSHAERLSVVLNWQGGVPLEDTQRGVFQMYWIRTPIIHTNLFSQQVIPS